ncbi:hypothetical protein SZ64_04410 [Erythrobacter sp. SG61-1L]|uniref:hypothetical protein n=1 Tax=Erythrobacter sp. SG61-1L TaxID=1603897 RepID=UPI0006C92492|nr:hypothetical protein [Erythrobacter sp. SG61-1L]KPL67413.1 hypothetical protein SZ64_04410 [Erythrobacter sp. SG61-1L]
MATPNLDDWTGRLDAACRDFLYETIQYQPAGGSYGAVKARVEYQDATRSFEVSQAIVQAIRVSLLKSDVPAKPGGTCRLMLAKMPGKTFRPVNVGQDEAGTHWEFDVETMSG